MIEVGAVLGSVVEVNGRSLASRIHTEGPVAAAAYGLYTCISPQGKYMNRFTSNYLDETRLLPWLTWKIGGDGYLHWGYNYWHDVFTAPYPPADTLNDAQTGDHWLVYPDKAAYDVYAARTGPP
jgi:hypothetical protein